MFLFIALLVVAWPLSTQARMFIDCTFGKINTPEGQKMTAKFTANLPAFKHFSHFCFVETSRDGQIYKNHFLQVRAKRNNESRGEHMSIRSLTFCFKILLIMHGNLDRRPFWNRFELITPNRVRVFLLKKLHSKWCSAGSSKICSWNTETIEMFLQHMTL